MYILFFQGKLGELEAGIIGENFMASTMNWIRVSEFLPLLLKCGCKVLPLISERPKDMLSFIGVRVTICF